MREKKMAVAIATASLAATGLLATTATAVTETSDVTVVHGIPGATVDVYVNGDLLLEDFVPMDTAGPLALGVATYDIEVFAANADPGTATAIIDQMVDVPAAGLDLDLVAAYTAAGDPVLSAFVNETGRTGADVADIVVRHTAAAPAVDVRAGGAVVIADLANPDEDAVAVPTGTYAIDVVATGGDTAVIGPVDLAVEAGTRYTVYAVGSLGAESLDLFVYADQVGDRDYGRLAGPSRVETAVAISQHVFPGGANRVYLARSDAFADGLAGGVVPDGPVLLVPSCGDLPQAVADEIRRLNPSQILALGGEGAVCGEILKAAAAVG